MNPEPALSDYLVLKQESCVSSLSRDYSAFFQYKSIKRFLPSADLSRFQEELIKSRLHLLAKQQEKAFQATFETLNQENAVGKVLEDLHRVHTVEEIARECGTGENEDAVDKTLIPVILELLKAELKEK